MRISSNVIHRDVVLELIFNYLFSYLINYSKWVSFFIDFFWKKEVTIEVSYSFIYIFQNTYYNSVSFHIFQNSIHCNIPSVIYTQMISWVLWMISVKLITICIPYLFILYKFEMREDTN